MGIALAAVALIHAILFVVIRRSPTRELALFIAVSFIGLYGSLGNFLTPIIGETAFISAWTILHLVLIGWVYRFGQAAAMGKAIPVIVFTIGLTIVFQIGGVGLPVASDSRLVSQLMGELESSDECNKEKRTSIAKDRPDIYYIIVDAYAGEAILKQVYDFDNQPFTDALRERGFFVGDKSRSNYHLTELSLASSLNMRHIHDVGLHEFKTRIPIRQMIAESSVARFLTNRGYKTIALETGKSDTQCKGFDQYFPVGNALNDYQDVLYHGTLLPKLLELVGNPVPSAARRHGERTIKTLEAIPTVVTPGSQPSFVFSHLLAPHPPFVNDSAGQVVDLHGYYLLADSTHFTACYDYDLEIYRNAYRSQVAFINQKLMEMVDRIQDSDRSSVIIIQADHGPRMGFGTNPSAEVRPEDVNLRFQEAYSILNAIYLPEDLNPEFYSSMTPVNTFRLIFNEMFDARLNLEPDDSYFEENYAFENATDKTMPRKTETKTAITQTR